MFGPLPRAVAFSLPFFASPQIGRASAAMILSIGFGNNRVIDGLPVGGFITPPMNSPSVRYHFLCSFFDRYKPK